MTDKFWERLSQFQNRDMVALVARENRWFGVRTAVSLTVSLVALWFAMNTASWWSVLAAGWLGLCLGRLVLVTLRRAAAYRSGWVDGRTAMVAALSESMRRGMSPEDWLRAEYVRDMAMLGVGPEDLR